MMAGDPVRFANFPIPIVQRLCVYCKILRCAANFDLRLACCISPCCYLCLGLLFYSRGVNIVQMHLHVQFRRFF